VEPCWSFSVQLFQAQQRLHWPAVLNPLLEEGHPPPPFQGEVITNLQERVEGVRLKHQVNQNSLKLYDKAYTSQGSVWRAEVTLNHCEEFRVYRRKEGDPQGQKQWRLLRRAQVSPQINERYLTALALVNDDTSKNNAPAPPGSVASSDFSVLTDSYEKSPVPIAPT
jgi:hypothetical protein